VLYDNNLYFAFLIKPIARENLESVLVNE
jgi:hypothetical protein